MGIDCGMRIADCGLIPLGPTLEHENEKSPQIVNSYDT